MRRVLVAVAVAVASTAALSVWAHGPRGGMGDFGGMGPGMMMGGPGPMGRGIDRMLDGIDATDQQRSQIKQITEAAAADLRGQREQRQSLADRAMQVFTAPTVDAAAAEQVRQQMLQQHDQASRRMTTAMIDISRVLTPEQRTKLAERMKERRERMRERFQRERPKQ
jgi:Spy/CpxP family protein refolding chaperone